jgi:hypothetical protein
MDDDAATTSSSPAFAVVSVAMFSVDHSVRRRWSIVHGPWSIGARATDTRVSTNRRERRDARRSRKPHRERRYRVGVPEMPRLTRAIRACRERCGFPRRRAGSRTAVCRLPRRLQTFDYGRLTTPRPASSARRRRRRTAERRRADRCRGSQLERASGTAACRRCHSRGRKTRSR